LRGHALNRAPHVSQPGPAAFPAAFQELTLLPRTRPARRGRQGGGVAFGLFSCVRPECIGAFRAPLTSVDEIS